MVGSVVGLERLKKLQVRELRKGGGGTGTAEEITGEGRRVVGRVVGLERMFMFVCLCVRRSVHVIYMTIQLITYLCSVAVFGARQQQPEYCVQRDHRVAQTGDVTLQRQ